jgi:signal transduction histidine kinase
MTRLTVPIAVVSTVLLLTAGGAAWYVHRMQATTSEVLANNVASVRAAQELEISVREVQTQFDRYLIAGNRQHLDAVPRLKRRTEQALSEAERLATTAPERALMDRVRQGYEHFFREYERLAQEPVGTGLHGQVAKLIDTVLDEEILDPAHEYLRLNEGMVAHSTEANQALADRLTVALVALGVCGAVGGVLGGWALAAAVRRSLQRAEDRLRDTAVRLSGAVPNPTGPGADAWQHVSESVTAVLRRLKQSERDALRAEQLAWAGQMAAGVAHEVRNPLMAIKLIVQAAADPGRSHRFGPRDLAVLEEEIVRLEDITANFLDFARPPSPDKKPVALLPVVEQAVGRVRARAELQGVRISVDSPAGPVPVLADGNQIRQVVYNLLFNALEAQPGGGWVRVTLTVDPRHAEVGAGAALSVEDGGPGVPSELGDQIFDPFVSTKDTGMGLGLSICRRIVEAHGWIVRVSNTPDGGAVFTVHIPVADGALAAPADVT